MQTATPTIRTATVYNCLPPEDLHGRLGVRVEGGLEAQLAEAQAVEELQPGVEAGGPWSHCESTHKMHSPAMRCTQPQHEVHTARACMRMQIQCMRRLGPATGDWRQGASAHLLQHANEVAQREAIVAHHACKSKWRLGLVGERWGCRGCSHACERRWRLGLLGGAPAALVRACRSQAHDAMEPSRQQGQPATHTQTPRL